MKALSCAIEPSAAKRTVESARSARDIDPRTALYYLRRTRELAGLPEQQQHRVCRAIAREYHHWEAQASREQLAWARGRAAGVDLDEGLRRLLDAEL